jgi:hypothetical protein
MSYSIVNYKGGIQKEFATYEEANSYFNDHSYEENYLYYNAPDLAEHLAGKGINYDGFCIISVKTGYIFINAVMTFSGNP